MNAGDFLIHLRQLKRTHGESRADVTITPAELVNRWDGHYSAGTLANWRGSKGDPRGPKFVKIGGRILYPLDQVEAFERRMLTEAGGVTQ